MCSTCGRGLRDGALDLVEPLDPERPGGVEEGGEELLGHVDFAGVGELQHGGGLVPRSVLQDDDRVLARGLLRRRNMINFISKYIFKSAKFSDFLHIYFQIHVSYS